VFVELAEPVAEEEQSEDLLTAEEEKGQVEKKKRHWQASMPATSFSMDAFAEAWEYEADDDDEDVSASKRTAKLGPGILAQKFNRTVVQMDLVTGREAIGPIRVSQAILWGYLWKLTKMIIGSAVCDLYLYCGGYGTLGRQGRYERRNSSNRS
jgi:hypothetical protein